VRDGAKPEQTVEVEVDEMPGRDTIRSAAALGLQKFQGASMRRNPDEELTARDLAAAGRKAQKRVGLLRKLFQAGGSKAATKVAGKTAAKAGAKVAAKAGTKAIPVVGEVMMVIDALPEAIRVEKEKAAALRGMRDEVKAAKGVSATASALGRGVGEYAKLTASGGLRVGAAALVGSDVVHGMRKKNPASIKANVSEINSLLRKMPSDWRAQLNSSRMKLKAAGATSDELPPAAPDAHSVLLALNLNNRGAVSSEAAAGQEQPGGHAVPEDVREAAMEGIRLSHQNNYGGYDFIGVARAIQLAISPSISDAALRRMRMYFDRKTKQDRMSDQYARKSGKRYWSWLNWGGDPGARWSGSKRFAELIRSNPVRKVAMAQPDPYQPPEPSRFRVLHPRRGVVLAVRYPHIEDYSGADPEAALEAALAAKSAGYMPYIKTDVGNYNIRDLQELIMSRKKKDLENPYHKSGRDQWGKVCFYIYNDDGTPVLTGSGTPQWCYQPEKAEEMVRKAERRGLRVSPSAVSPGPRPAPSEAPRPAPAPTGFVRQRIQEQAARPIQHAYKVGDVVVKKNIAIDTADFYEVVSISPASVMVKAIGKRYDSGNLYNGTVVPDRSAEGYDSRRGTAPFRMMVGADGNLGSNENWTSVKRWDGRPVRVSHNDM
jgi:hypothetical protein